jgi:hypothetical protein
MYAIFSRSDYKLLPSVLIETNKVATPHFWFRVTQQELAKVNILPDFYYSAPCKLSFSKNSYPVTGLLPHNFRAVDSKLISWMMALIVAPI